MRKVIIYDLNDEIPNCQKCDYRIGLENNQNIESEYCYHCKDTKEKWNYQRTEIIKEKEQNNEI